MFAYVLRPSTIPCSKTIKSFSNKIISADSFATSTAVSTEIPISLTFIATASLMPSPINPTVWPFSRKIDTTRAFWFGVNLANTSVVSATFASSSSLILSKSDPSNILRTVKPTCLQIVEVTFSLSPVKIFVETPCSFNALIASAADFLAGSRKAKYPINTMSHSSCTPNVLVGEGLFFFAIARTRKPLLFRPSTVFRIRLRIFSSNGCTFASISA